MIEAKKIDLDEIDAVVEEWITKWQEGRLSCFDIVRYWRTRIPKVDYDPITMRSKYEEVFISTVEKFLFYGQSPEFIDNVYNENVRSTGCLKVLYENEMLYSCIDCKLTINPICGLCVECFSKSEHRFHRYKFRPSYLRNDICCCGQSEIWKTDSGCSTHSISEEDTDLLPKTLTSRAAIAIEAILRYNADVIDQEEYVPEDGCWDRNSFCAVLYNIESDLYDTLEEVPLAGDVITHLQHLEKEGTTIYQHGTKESCEDGISELLNQDYFKVSIIHSHEALHRNFAVRLLETLEKILKYGKDFRKIFGKLLTKPLSLNECFLEKYFINSLKLSLKFRFCCLKLLVSGTLKEYENKKMLSKEILRMYDKLAKQSIEVNATEFFDYKGHLFFDHTLTIYLMEDNFALTIFSKSIWENSEIHNIWKLKIGEELEDDHTNTFIVFSLILSDIRILLGSGLNKTWTRKLREAFLDGLSYLIKIFSEMHETNSYIRKPTQYNSSSYTLTLEMQFELGLTVEYLLQWCGDDQEVLMEAYKGTIKMLQNRFPDDFNQNAKIIHLLNHSARCLRFDSEAQSAAFCLPLTRFLAGLILIGWEKYAHMFNSIEVAALKSIVVPLIDPTLKLHVMIAQESAGLWKQNGHLLPDSISQYQNDNHRSAILDRDIQVLQILASIMDPNEFLIHALNKYDLVSWAERNFEENLNSNDKENAKVFICMAENFLNLLINVITERHIPEVGYVTNKDIVKNEVIHRLCIKPRSRSELQTCSSIFNSDFEIGVIDEVIHEVAVFKTPDDKLYVLREKFYDQYNPFFYHYTPEEIVAAQDCQRRRLKAAKKSEFIPPPVLPKLKKSFSSIVQIFRSDILLHIMKLIIERSIDLNSKSFSHGQLQNALYLIGFALLDEESGHYDFLSFVDKATNWKIFELLEELLKSARDDIPKGLIKWILRKYSATASDSTNSTNWDFEVFDESFERKKILAAERRAKIVKEMSEMRNQFVQKDIIINDIDESLPTIEEKTCLLCHQTHSSGLQNKPFVALGNMSFSTVLLKQRENTVNSPLLSSNLGPAYFTSTCGHLMHLSCWEDYFREAENPSLNCPLCNNRCSILFPVFPNLNQFDVENFTFHPDLKKLTTKFANSCSNSQCENPLELWKSLAYTVHVIETSMRDLNKPLLENFSSRNRASLESLVRVAAASNIICIPNETFKFNISQIDLLLSGKTSNLGTILHFDMFGLLVVMVLSKSDFLVTLRSVFLAELVKILICTDFDKMNDESIRNCFDLQSPIKQILEIVSKHIHHLSDDFIWTYVRTACVPFLRCCVIFYKFFREIPSPVQLTELGGDSFSNMCSYLGLPQTREEIFEDPELFSVIKSWCSHPSVLESLDSGKAVYSTAVPQLIELPNEYSELVTKISMFRDHHGSNKFGITYKLCLTCGEVFCSGSCCMELDQFKDPVAGHFCHMRNCAGVGLFLSVHQCFIIAVISPNVFINIPAPYINKYNEYESTVVDCKLNGYPLKFSPKMYKDLHREWLSHGILDKIKANNISGREDMPIFMMIEDLDEESDSEDYDIIVRDDVGDGHEV